MLQLVQLRAFLLLDIIALCSVNSRMLLCGKQRSEGMDAVYHGCPTFLLAWAILNEWESSCAASKIFNNV